MYWSISMGYEKKLSFTGLQAVYSVPFLYGRIIIDYEKM